MSDKFKIIKAAAGMGYAAKISILNEICCVVYVCEDYIVVIENEWPRVFRKKDVNILFEIAGFTYVGNLFGEPVIPEGQKFATESTWPVATLLYEGNLYNENGVDKMTTCAKTCDHGDCIASFSRLPVYDDLGKKYEAHCMASVFPVFD